MALTGKQEFLMEDSTGKIYNFYLDEKEEISCISSNEQRKWIDQEVVFPKRCSSLDIFLDERDSFHIVSYHYDGELYYSYKGKEQWKNIQLHKFKRSESSFYPRITSIGSNIHIFYDLQETNTKGRCALFHYTYDDKKMTWISNNICTIKFNKFVNPYKVLTYRNRVVILYTSIVKETEEVFIVQYNTNSDQWGKPQQVTNNDERKLYLDGLIDSEGYLHITWCHYVEEDGLTVKYFKTDIKKTSFTEEEILTLSDRLNCSFPHLIYLNQGIYCMWVQLSYLGVVTSIDGGNNWSKANIAQSSKNVSFKRYRYITNNPQLRSTLIGDILYGTEYPRIEFLGFGGDVHDEVSADEY